MGIYVQETSLILPITFSGPWATPKIIDLQIRIQSGMCSIYFPEFHFPATISSTIFAEFPSNFAPKSLFYSQLLLFSNSAFANGYMIFLPTGQFATDIGTPLPGSGDAGIIAQYLQPYQLAA